MRLVELVEFPPQIPPRSMVETVGGIWGASLEEPPIQPTSTKTQDDGFRLIVRHLNDEWLNLKLTTPMRLPKRNWWLAWNGEKFAGHKDFGLLAEHHPDVLQELLKLLGEQFPASYLQSIRFSERAVPDDS